MKKEIAITVDFYACINGHTFYVNSAEGNKITEYNDSSINCHFMTLWHDDFVIASCLMDGGASFKLSGTYETTVDDVTITHHTYTYTQYYNGVHL